MERPIFWSSPWLVERGPDGCIWFHRYPAGDLNRRASAWLLLTPDEWAALVAAMATPATDRP